VDFFHQNLRETNVQNTEPRNVFRERSENRPLRPVRSRDVAFYHPSFSYYAFVKMQHSNPCALLLPMLLTDTLYDADHVVAIYARLQV